VTKGAHGCGGKAHTTDRGRTRLWREACKGADGGAYDGSLHKFQDVTVLLDEPLPKCFND
jgi:hypothetical protein